MGTAKRERQKAGRAQRLEEARIAEARHKRRNQYILYGAIAAFVAVIIAIGYLRPKDESSTASTTTTAPTTTSPTGSTAPALVKVAPGASITGATPCPAADGSAQRTTTFAQAPPTCIDPAKAYTAKISTSKGDFTITLDAKTAPNTVNNFVVLSRYHFYDGVPFHRVVSGFVIQTGDPLGDPPGTGTPGYKFDDELPKTVDDYKPGSVAMANSGPNTNGSQWFVYVGPNKLPSPAYSLFGNVTEGYDTTVQAIIKGAAPGSDGAPADPTTINYVLIGEDGTYPPPPTTPVPTVAPTTATSIPVVPSVSTPASDPSLSGPTSTVLSGAAGSEPGLQTPTPGAPVSTSPSAPSTP